MANVIELENVSKTFGAKKAVNDVSLSLTDGEIYGFLGPNGAGKTTTIRMIMDFIRPSSGSVKLFDKDIGPNSVKNLHKIGFLSADSVLYSNWNAQQHISYVENIRGKKSSAATLSQKFGLDVHTKYHRLSSGNKQKLALILALMHSPKLLILDEPTRGLDPLLQQEIYEILIDFKKSGGSVFMSSHNLSEVQKVCDHVGIIRDGRMVASETMNTLREMHLHQITVQFEKPVDVEKFRLPNVEIKKATKHEITANVQGDLNPFMSNVMQYKISDIEIGHVSLEDMFMRYYA